MSTSVPNFNFLALLVSDIWRGPKIKIGVLLSLDAPYRTNFYMQMSIQVRQILTSLLD